MLPDASKKGYVSVVQSLVAFSKANHEDGGSEKRLEKQRRPWFSPGRKHHQPPSSCRQQIQQDKVTKYKDKFDPRVTAR